MSAKEAPKRILILAANPIDTDRLRLDKEVREIKEVLRLAKQRDRFEVSAELAATPDDIQQALVDYSPNIVHFCGHGEGSEGLILEGDNGTGNLVSADALANLFELFAEQVECVLLNACYSDEQADAIVQHIDAVIGMSQSIGDTAARKFAVGFYRGLGAGRDVEFAYKLGRNAIEMANLRGEQTPVLRQKEQVAEPPEPEGSTPVISAKVFISYRSKDPDQGLAQIFHDALKAAGHHVFMAAENIRLGDDWPQRIDDALEEADYFLLLLSPKAATSEMVLDEVRKAKRFRDTRPDHRPVILPIRVNFPIQDPLNYDLRSYLHLIQQREWSSDQDTDALLAEVLSIIATGRQNDAPESEPPDPPSPPPTGDSQGPPRPVADPEIPMGQVDIASEFYVERPPIEARCYEAILKPSALIRIKAPRQMGKTSLMARILYRAAEAGYKTVPLSFQLADEIVFADLDAFLQWFCASVTSELELVDCLDDHWQTRIGSKMSCTNYFERYLLKQVDEPMVLGLDEVDLVFQHSEIASNFFGLLRAWHEKSKSRVSWKKLRLVVVHSTEVYIPLNMHQSPFNVGLPIELPEFTEGQVLDLAKRHGLDWQIDAVKELMSMVGGHPYLVREALYHITHQDLTLDELLETAFTESGLYGDHLRRHWWNLSQHPELAEAIREVVLSNKPVRLKPVHAFQLHSMGLVNLQGNDVTPRCDLYRQYFRSNRMRGEE
ncbi:MAG: TIR domain-containing protein [Leptolyngbya sp. SIOISBB]|nr:TIR domain-containing protein [Leptolyngbya sp. SIOISBB]